eukprot:3137591-Pleurochrysis_carterae.AAC.1
MAGFFPHHLGSPRHARQHPDYLMFPSWLSILVRAKADGIRCPYMLIRNLRSTFESMRTTNMSLKVFSMLSNKSDSDNITKSRA